MSKGPIQVYINNPPLNTSGVISASEAMRRASQAGEAAAREFTRYFLTNDNKTMVHHRSVFFGGPFHGQVMKREPEQCSDTIELAMPMEWHWGVDTHVRQYDYERHIYRRERRFHYKGTYREIEAVLYIWQRRVS